MAIDRQVEINREFAKGMVSGDKEAFSDWQTAVKKEAKKAKKDPIDYLTEDFKKTKRKPVYRNREGLDPEMAMELMYMGSENAIANIAVRDSRYGVAVKPGEIDLGMTGSIVETGAEDGVAGIKADAAKRLGDVMDKDALDGLVSAGRTAYKPLLSKFKTRAKKIGKENVVSIFGTALVTEDKMEVNVGKTSAAYLAPFMEDAAGKAYEAGRDK